MSEPLIPKDMNPSPIAVKCAKEIINGKKYFDILAEMFKTKFESPETRQAAHDRMKEITELVFAHARSKAIAYGRAEAEKAGRKPYPLGEKDLQVVKDKYKELCKLYGINPRPTESPPKPRYEMWEFDGSNENFYNPSKIKYELYQDDDFRKRDSKYNPKYKIRDTKTNSFYRQPKDRSKGYGQGSVWDNWSAARGYTRRLNNGELK